MRLRPADGFILPLALVLGTSLLFLAVLSLESGIRSAEITARALSHKRAETILMMNLRHLMGNLEEAVLREGGASAELADPARGTDLFETVLVQMEPGDRRPLRSRQPAAPAKVAFRSPTGGHRLIADRVRLTAPDIPEQVSLAWSAEDIHLAGPESPPPDFWPLPSWNLAPAAAAASPPDILDAATGGACLDGPWIASHEPLPMLPETAPALLPVTERLALHFGIFASGTATQREKTVRIRFHIEGAFWNPYNREMRLHPGSGRRTVLRVVFWNLPEVRIHNPAKGVSTAWIPLDEADNSASGTRGLHAWITLPGSIGPGEVLIFSEPDPSRQPEGLARTLHGGFMVAPGDAVRIEFREQPGGIHAACLPPEATDALQAALDGEGWHRIEGFSADWPTLDFPAAGIGERPFLLDGGSLSYRRDNAHTRIAFSRAQSRQQPQLDPRRRRVAAWDALTSAEGTVLSGAELIRTEVTDLTVDAETGIDEEPAAALLSWPSRQPQSLVEATDLPSWPEGFRLGSRGAHLLNKTLDVPWMLAPAGEVPVPLLPADRAEDPIPYRGFFHINGRSPTHWRTLLEDSATAGDRYPVYASTHPEALPDHRRWTPDERAVAARFVAGQTALSPFGSVGEFFSSGVLADAFPVKADAPYPHGLVPLRGWLRRAPAPRTHGAAWLLHIVLQVDGPETAFRKSARLWLLETVGEDGQPRFERIRFEWTDPSLHVADLNP